MSNKWRLNWEDIDRVLKNALIFSAPVAIVELQLIQQGASTEQLLIALKVWGLGVALDFFRKLRAGN